MRDCTENSSLVPPRTEIHLQRFPAQEQVGGDAKIPSIIWYDQDGNVKSVGAEALADQEWVVEEEEDNGLIRAEW